MLKAGIFLDVENLSRNGGWGIQYNVIKEIVQAQQAIVVRANAYMAVDMQREQTDSEYALKVQGYRDAIRRNGFHLVLKEVKRFRNEDGEIVLKANADLDLAVDALLQSENLDYVLLGSGDGDFIRLVRALQNRVKRVDLLSFANTSTDLRREVDYHFDGFLFPGVLRADVRNNGNGRQRGYMHRVNEEQGYGFITMRTGLGADSVRSDVFCHITDFSINGSTPNNSAFGELKTRRTILEFDLKQSDRGLQAVNVNEFNWNDT